MHLPLLTTTTLLASLLPLALATPSSDDGTLPGYSYGNMFYLGPPAGGQYITHASYSLALPAPPTDYRKTSSSQIWLDFWIGLQGNPAGKDVMEMNFVQPLLNWAVDQEAAGCSADLTHWCAAASTFTPSGQLQQPYLPIPSDTTLDFDVSINENGTIHQTISMHGSVISEQSDSQGMKPAVFYSGTECYDNGCGTVAAHSWSNITLTLSSAAPDFSKTLTLTGATSSGMQTSDGGKTWTITSITIEKQNMTK